MAWRSSFSVVGTVSPKIDFVVRNGAVALSRSLSLSLSLKKNPNKVAASCRRIAGRNEASCHDPPLGRSRSGRNLRRPFELELRCANRIANYTVSRRVHWRNFVKRPFRLPSNTHTHTQTPISRSRLCVCVVWGGNHLPFPRGNVLHDFRQPQHRDRARNARIRPSITRS